MSAFTLSGGELALVDPEDLPFTEGTRWWAKYTKAGDVGTVTSSRGHLARLLLGAPPGMCVDHINGDPLDNRRANIRLCTHAQNMRNRKTARHSKTGVKGVHLRKNGKYRARITHAGRCYYLGDYATAERASERYQQAAIRLHGEFARRTPPEKNPQ